ncbi:MAG: hypothetical protein JOZ81_25565 [Chloroflexi bacterium]|nr:hypothetical protein [Chloroflexota bacterium]MBV9544760.1 hypothetical protein [Chloroflexota bacterium]
MRSRRVLACFGLLCVGLTACGGTPRAASADLGPVLQPTPDPTLDAVVRGLPSALAGVQPTPTPTPQPPAAPRSKPAPSKPSRPTASPTRARR